MNKKDIIKQIKKDCPIELDTKKLNSKPIEELQEISEEMKQYGKEM